MWEGVQFDSYAEQVIYIFCFILFNFAFLISCYNWSHIMPKITPSCLEMLPFVGGRYVQKSYKPELCMNSKLNPLVIRTHSTHTRRKSGYSSYIKETEGSFYIRGLQRRWLPAPRVGPQISQDHKSVPLVHSMSSSVYSFQTPSSIHELFSRYLKNQLDCMVKWNEIISCHWKKSALRSWCW